ncbi:molybdopterin-dependent oxidoreductase [Haloplanus salilacus]|uniref:molybdopterin-dependent oxidoreductase n=1 Tax=Haloplanus salilacus TaxID=2949994 RepID=UPI0030D051F9
MTDLERHPIPADVDPEAWTLDVTGSVDRPLTLTRDDLSTYSLDPFHEDFDCEAGWTAEGLAWRGIRVGVLLDRATPTEDTAYGLVRAMDGDYACSFPVDRLHDALLAVELDGEPLPAAHGGPARLVPTGDGGDCWESVKWVSEIELLEREPTTADTAESLALSRID